MHPTCVMRIGTDSGTLVFHRGLIVRSTVAIRALQLLAVFFGAIYLLFVARLILTYAGADPNADFVRLIWASTGALYAPVDSASPYLPFQWLFRAGDDGAGHPLEWSLLIAIAAYAVAHALLRKLVLVLGRPPR